MTSSDPAGAVDHLEVAGRSHKIHRLDRLGVTYRRRDDLMKPVLLGLSRRVDAAELFPDRDFPLR